ALWEPFRTAGSFGGGVWLSSVVPEAFSEEHQQILRPIAAILGTAVEHWRIWDVERRRRDRLDQIETLLRTLAQSLDIRVVFDRISQATKPILPHDLMALSELDIRARTIEVVAVAGEADIPAPTQTVRLSDEEFERRSRDFDLVQDIPTELSQATERDRL